jgi:hypothetical protein
MQCVFGWWLSMTIDPQLLSCVRSEYDCLCEDLRHMERGEWSGVTRREVTLLRDRLRRLAMLVVLNDWAGPKKH